MYMDGDTVNVGSSSTEILLGVDKLDQTGIGAKVDDAPNWHHDGLGGHFAIWNVALIIAEIVALARGVNPLRVRRASLKGYWPVFGVHDPEIDLIAGNNMTLSGTPLRAAIGPPVEPVSSIWWGGIPLIETGAGAQSATPDAISVVLVLLAPTTTKGGATTSAPVLTPSLTLVGPTVSKPISRSVQALTPALALQAPTVTKGTVSTSAGVLAPKVITVTPTVITVGVQTATPATLSVSLGINAPGVSKGAASTASPVLSVSLAAVGPTVSKPISRSVQALSVPLAVVGAGVSKGAALTAAPALTPALTTIAPSVSKGAVTVSAPAETASLVVVAPLRVATWSTAGPPFSIFRYDAANWLSTDDWYVEAMVDCITPSMFLELFDDTDNVPVAGSLASIGAIPDEYTRLRGGPCTENLQDGHDYRVRVGSGIGADGNAYAAKIVNVR
jgi:hypothetical protein